MRRFVLFAMLFFALSIVSHAQAAYIYTLDIDIPEIGAIDNLTERIGGAELQVLGGGYGTNWDLELGDAVPDAGSWIFEPYGGGWYAVYDDYPIPLEEEEIAPMIGGTVFTITSDVELSFEKLLFYDYHGGEVSKDYFSSELNVVPIPSAVLLLGTGLVGFVAMRRRHR